MQKINAKLSNEEAEATASFASPNIRPVDCHCNSNLSGQENLEIQPSIESNFHILVRKLGKEKTLQLQELSVFSETEQQKLKIRNFTSQFLR